MFFFFTCGTHTFTSALPPLPTPNQCVQCQNCGNMSARPAKRWQWATFCFVPVVPFSLKPWKEVGCPVCGFWQDVKYRPDVLQMLDGHGGGHGQQGYAMNGVQGQGPGQQQYK